MITTDIKEKLESLHQESFAWAVRCCHQDRIAAEEVLQLTYLKVLEGKAKFKAESTFKTWLFAIIRYTAIDFYKNTKRSLISSIEMNATQLLLDKQEQQVIFQKALSQLSPNQSRILHLVFYQDLTIQEAAEVMELQLGTARTHYKRGKQQLKKWLTKAGFASNGKFIL